MLGRPRETIRWKQGKSTSKEQLAYLRGFFHRDGYFFGDGEYDELAEGLYRLSRATHILALFSDVLLGDVNGVHCPSVEFDRIKLTS